MYDVERSVVICSATESVKESSFIKNGIAALRYLNPGKLTNPLLKIPTEEIITDPRTIEQFLIYLDSLLNFFIISHTITYAVENNNSKPGYPPKMKLEGRSNNPAHNTKDIENMGIAKMR